MKSHVVFYLIKRLKKELTKHCKPFMGWVRITDYGHPIKVFLNILNILADRAILSLFSPKAKVFIDFTGFFILNRLGFGLQRIWDPVNMYP